MGMAADVHGRAAPPPPPPPREDDGTFVRRVRLTYMDRAANAHERAMLFASDDLEHEKPRCVFSMSLLLPYVAGIQAVGLHIFIIITYAFKFGRTEEKYWYYASGVGIGLVCFVLEVMRATATTVIELRIFETRRQHATGDFLKSTLRRAGDDEQEKLPALRPKRPPKPSIPLALPKAPLQKFGAIGAQRPSFLPPRQGGELPIGAPPPAPPLQLGVGAVPALKLQGKGSLGAMTPPEGSTPKGGSLLPGRLDRTMGSSPRTPMGSSRTPPNALGPPMSPASVTESLSQKLRDGRDSTTGRPPPRPPGGTPPKGPPSHRSGSSGGKAAPPKPPTPPPPWATRRAGQAQAPGPPPPPPR